MNSQSETESRSRSKNVTPLQSIENLPENDPIVTLSNHTKNYTSTVNNAEEGMDQLNEKKSLERIQHKSENKTSAILALNAAAALDGCDDQLLPASFRALETELKFHPSLLGRITLCQTMALSLSCPFWGYLADRYSRKRIMSTGMVSWGIVTTCLAFASNLPAVMILRAMNGLFLGSIGPISQSILADISPELSRGFQFGLIQMCASGGRIIGGVVTTSIALVHFGGLYGWRWTFMAVGILSICLGLLIGLCLREFSRVSKRTHVNSLSHYLSHELSAGTGETKTRSESMDTEADVSYRITETGPPEHDEDFIRHDQTPWQFFGDVIGESFMKPSVLVILLEGIVGTIPWSAMSFLTMYFQYCGLSDVNAAICSASLLLGAMISGPIGGFLGDRVHQWSYNHGRAFLGQLSMLLRVPLLVIAFLVVPPQPSSFGALAFICLCIGLCSIAGVVVNRPLLSDVVRPNHRATTFALAVAIEGASGALLGAPLVGLFSEQVFGYIKTDLQMVDIPPELRLNNAYALGKALICLTAIPWSFSFFIYGFVHLTYGSDRNKLKRKLLRELGYEDELDTDIRLMHSDTATLSNVSLIKLRLQRNCTLKSDNIMQPIPLCQGIAFTYCWLFCCFLSSLTESVDALALSFCVGFGLNLSWYTTQLVDSLLWSNLIPYWHEYFPHWCTESLIRLGDILLHPLPFYFLLPYHRYVNFRIGLYAFLLERWYFILVEGQPLGTGCVTNIIYDFRPHLPPRSFLLSQYITNLGYMLCTTSTINYHLIRVPLQIIVCSFILFLCVIHTDRWNNRKHELPEFPRRFVGVALEQPIGEEYALVLNAYSLQLHQQFMEKMEELMSPETRAQLLASLPSPGEISADFWKRLPEGLTLSHGGLIVEGISGPGTIVWERLAAIVATLTCKLQQMRESVGLPGLPNLELPSLETLHAAVPNMELAELARIHSVLETMVPVIRPAILTGQQEPPMPRLDMKTNQANKLKAIEQIEPMEKQESSGPFLKDEIRQRKVVQEGGLYQHQQLDNTLTVPTASLSIPAETLKEQYPNSSSRTDAAAWAEAVQTLRRMLWPTTAPTNDQLNKEQ